MKKLIVCTWALFCFQCLDFSTKSDSTQDDGNLPLCCQGVDTSTVSAEEIKLYQLITNYRKQNGLSSIPFSKSLTKVARAHVRDLEDNNPITSSCNMHSWSNKGTWGACCYTGDHANAQCMWDKPKELTEYKGNGYENSYMSFPTATAQGALDGWKKSTGHNQVILNQGIWKNRAWKALGVGIYKRYAVIWFGNQDDPAGVIGMTL